MRQWTWCYITFTFVINVGHIIGHSSLLVHSFTLSSITQFPAKISLRFILPPLSKRKINGHYENVSFLFAAGS